MITREQIADLREGDVVEITSTNWGPGASMRGPLVAKEDGALDVGRIGWTTSRGFCVRRRDGEPAWGNERTLTVISRVPRPLYVNHPRTEPVPGDVVRDADGETWLRDSFGTWHSPDSTCDAEHQDTGLAQPLRLLVSGSTGTVVSS